LPPLAAHVWTHFLDLRKTRQATDSGSQRIPRVEIHAWERDEGVRLAPWERRAVMALDALELSILHKPAKG